ncbi:MAG: hypothetical protein V1914_02390 [archaeon]
MTWNPDKPLKELPEHIRQLFTEDARHLLNELNSNPPWYRILHNSYSHFRRDRSLKALERIAESNDGKFVTSISKYVPFKYHAVYRDLILERLTQGCKDDSLPPNKKAVTYFKDILSKEVEIPYDKDEDYEDKVPF